MNRADDAEMARIEKTETEVGGNVAVLTKRARVLAVRLGSGRTSGTTFLDWLIQRARNQGVRSFSRTMTGGLQTWPGCIRGRPCSRRAMTAAT